LPTELSGVLDVLYAAAPEYVSTALQYALLGALYVFLYKVFHLLFEEFSSNFANEGENALRRASLAVIDGAPEHRKYAFGDSVTIGRNADNDIVLRDQYISHYHARVRRVGDEYVLTDLDSINNTYLNGDAIEGETALKSGDCIRVGRVVLKFER